MNYVEVECATCGKPVKKPKNEYNRSMRLSRKFYCNNRCSGLQSNHLVGNYNHNLLHVGSSKDEFSPFRRHLISIRSRCRRLNRDNDLTLDELKQQWNAQNGVCPYTGWEMENPVSTSENDKLPKTIRRASLDRIDSSCGYIKENIQFVCYMAQCAKNEFTHEELVSFCKAVAKKNVST